VIALLTVDRLEVRYGDLIGVADVSLTVPEGAVVALLGSNVEGGNATLFVAPSGESVLIDTGNFGPDAAKRDAERIMAAAKDAHLSQIDHLITTHWHGDHFGGMVEVANRIPIREFIDHGPNIQPVEAFDEFFAKSYPALYSKAKHRGQAGRYRPGRRAGLAHRVVGRSGAQDAARRCRRAKPVLRELKAAAPRTHSRSAASSPLANSGWRISAISPRTRNSS
jgi:hypothetical protein